MALSRRLLVSSDVSAFSVETRFQMQGAAMRREGLLMTSLLTKSRKFRTFGIWDKLTVVPTVIETAGLRSPDCPPDREFTSFCQQMQELDMAFRTSF